MNTFTIDDDNNIAAYACTEEANQSAAAGLIHFDSQAALARVSASWPLSRFVEIWNSIPGQSPVKKFQDRRKAIGRVWNAIQSGVGKPQPESAAAKPAARPKLEKPTKPIKLAKKVGRGKQARSAKQRPNKKADVIVMMKRTNGATLAEIMAATHWQKHTIRGFVSILGRKSGLLIQSCKNAAGERTYKIAK